MSNQDNDIQNSNFPQNPEGIRKAIRFEACKSAAWANISARCGMQSDKPRNEVSLWRKALRVAAVLIPILVVGTVAVLLSNSNQSAEGTDYYAQTESATYTLPDGSYATLDKGSHIRFAQDARGRHVELNGHAFFEVEHDASKPFVVKTSDVAVQVLGTKFSVEHWDNQERVRTCVTQGLVGMTAGGQTVKLSANEEALWSAGKLTKRSSNGSHCDTHKGNISFENASIYQVADELATLYHHKICGVRMEGNPDTTRITTEFHNEPLSSVVEELNLHFDKKIAVHDGYLIISD